MIGGESYGKEALLGPLSALPRFPLRVFRPHGVATVSERNPTIFTNLDKKGIKSGSSGRGRNGGFAPSRATRSERATFP